jgi:hypothetical protein
MLGLGVGANLVNAAFDEYAAGSHRNEEIADLTARKSIQHFKVISAG